ncbi:hypothetical protein IEQ34_014645 [Dendrobium chrysotoxum]|uniref:Uncharacterized protein n=1 Tax=Dendrobium chrysotoxum TaxID=161865 RepID=A0AAV7GMK4_DENCH|nr:hypothetical protein IEQ34_014645 [Dendrobium chrysotoxum]
MHSFQPFKQSVPNGSELLCRSVLETIALLPKQTPEQISTVTDADCETVFGISESQWAASW